MFNKIKEIFKKKKEEILYLQEEVKFNNLDDLKPKKETKSETKSSLTLGK
jgi:hypothetical protein